MQYYFLFEWNIILVFEDEIKPNSITQIKINEIRRFIKVLRDF